MLHIVLITSFATNIEVVRTVWLSVANYIQAYLVYVAKIETRNDYLLIDLLIFTREASLPNPEYTSDLIVYVDLEEKHPLDAS